MVSLQSYKIQRTLRDLSVEVRQDLERALLQQDKVYLSIAYQQRGRVEPGLQFLKETGVAYFWEVTDELALDNEKAILYVGTASDIFKAHLDQKILRSDA